MHTSSGKAKAAAISTRQPGIAIVVAAAENNVIGRDGTLPWRLPSDLKRFRALTLGHPIIMGRKTYQSIGKPLDGRDNIVVTRDRGFNPAGVLTAASLSEALALALEKAGDRGSQEIMIIGGAEIYRAALPHTDRIYLTRVHGSPAGDTFFPEPPEADWKLVRREPLPRGDTDEYAATLLVFDRKSAN